MEKNSIGGGNAVLVQLAEAAATMVIYICILALYEMMQRKTKCVASL